MKQVFAPADDIADGEMYLRLAADMESRTGELKARYKATGDMKIYYSIFDRSILTTSTKNYYTTKSMKGR